MCLDGDELLYALESLRILSDSSDGIAYKYSLFFPSRLLSFAGWSSFPTILFSSNPLQTMAPTQTQARNWRKETKQGDVMISTARDLLDLDFINTAFGSEDMYWAKSLDHDHLELMLSQSQTLELYKIIPGVPPEAEVPQPTTPETAIEGQPQEQLQQIGLARFVTDYVTTTYLTDVYVLREHRKEGLGRWLVGCCNEVINEMPALRRAVLMTDPKVGKAFYERELGFSDVRDESERVVAMNRRAFVL